MLPRYDVDRTDNRRPEVIEALVTALEPLLETWFRPVVRGLDRIPAGAALLVGNHNGGLCSADSFVLGTSLYRQGGLGALPYALAHETILGWPGMHQLLVALGAVRASPANGTRLLDSGHRVLVYPGGDLDSMRPFRLRDRIVFGPRRGYVRLALRTGVPIVPIVAAGAHVTSLVLTDGRLLAQLLGLRRLRLEVCPITLSVPWGLVVGITPPHLPFPTRIFLEALEPIRFERTGEAAASDPAYVEACHRRVHGAMESKLAELAAERRRVGWGEVRTPVPEGCAPVATTRPRSRGSLASLAL